MARKRDFADVVDEKGAVIGRINKNGQILRLHGMQGMGTFVPWGSIGGDIWEYFHPEQVKDEYAAVGKPPPTDEEIRSGALDNAIENANRNVQEGLQTSLLGASQIGKWLVIGLVAYAAIQVLQFVPKPRRK